MAQALSTLGKLSSNQGRFAQRLGFGACARSAFDPVHSISW